MYFQFDIKYLIIYRSYKYIGKYRQKRQFCPTSLPKPLLPSLSLQIAWLVWLFLRQIKNKNKYRKKKQFSPAACTRRNCHNSHLTNTNTCHQFKHSNCFNHFTFPSTLIFKDLSNFNLWCGGSYCQCLVYKLHNVYMSNIQIQGKCLIYVQIVRSKCPIYKLH